jgi:ABC-2 type transport system ATP-binding protein
MIEVDGLSKRYDQRLAVDGISFRAREGEVFGLLGPNGAGKSTTIACLSGLVEPDVGRIRLAGVDLAQSPRAAKSALGVVPQELALYEDLSARINLMYWAQLYGLSKRAAKLRVAEVLEQVDLADRADEPCKRFSGGMKRRLNFACGIVHAPKVLLLDEPTVGVDPQSRERLLEMVRDQAEQGTCVLYTTHYMEEAERLCDTLAIIDHGQIIAAGSLYEMRDQVGERDVLVLEGEFPQRDYAALFPSDLAVELSYTGARQLRLLLSDAPRKLSQLYACLQREGAEIRETSMTRPGLESLFIKLTGKGLRE